MFNFTTQTIYNSVSAPVTIEKGAGTRVSKNDNLILFTDEKLGPAVRIGNTRFNAKNVLDIHKKVHTDESLAQVEFDFAKLKTVVTGDGQDVYKGSYRIALYLGLVMNDQDSFYANDLVYKGKPLYIEFPINSEEETTAVTIARILKIAKKYMLLVYGKQILDFSDNDGKLLIKAVNGYQIIKKAELQKYDPAANQIDCCSNNGDFVTKITGIPCIFTTDANGVVVPGDKYLNEDGTPTAYDDTTVKIVPGAEAFCDYNWIIHNLRLPTSANTDFWAPTRLEMPVVGGKYTQFIIRLWARRDGIGGEVVGQRATSVTTHVLYVLDQGSNVQNVETALASLLTDKEAPNNKIKTDADDVLQAPYASVDSGNGEQNP